MLLVLRPSLIRLGEVSLLLLRTLRFSWQVSPKTVVLRAVVATFLGLLPVCVAFLTKLVVEIWSAGGVNGGGAMWGGLGASVCLVILVFSRSLLGAVEYVLHKIHSDQLHDHALVQGLSSVSKLGLSWFDFPEGHDSFQLGTEAASRPSEIVEALGDLVQAIVALTGFAWLIFGLNIWYCVILGVGVIPGGVGMFSAASAYSAWHKRTARERRTSNYYKYLLTTRSCAAELRSFGWSHILVVRTKQLLKELQEGRRKIYTREVVAEVCAF